VLTSAALVFTCMVQSMQKLDASEVAVLLRELGQRTMLAGAYLRAAESLAALAIPLHKIVEKNRLRDIPGVGETIADIVKKLHLTGSHPALEQMRQELPAGVLEMLVIPGLRLERVMKLYKELGISSLSELEAAARASKPGKSIGATLQRKVLQGLDDTTLGIRTSATC
jgi:DNA polymerase (family 10)